MTVKKTNFFLLITVVVGILFDLVISDYIQELHGISISAILKYSVLLIIGIIMLKKNNESVLEFLPFNVPAKLPTMLIIILIYFLILPVNATLAKVGALFGDTLSAVESKIVDKEVSVFANTVNMVIVPALFEEIFYRGFFFQGYRKNKGARTAIIMTSILFATFHMVPQQAVYTSFAGLVLAIIREMTGSMWPGIWLHFLNNGTGVIESIFSKNDAALKLLPTTYVNFDNTRNSIITIVATVISLPLIFLVLRKISRIEGKEEQFMCFFKEDRDRSAEEKVVTKSLVVALCLEGIMMVVAGAIGFMFG